MPAWWTLLSWISVVICLSFYLNYSIRFFDLDNSLDWFLKSFSRLLILDYNSLIFRFLYDRFASKLEILEFWFKLSLSNLFNLFIYYLAFLNYRSWSWLTVDLVFSWFSSSYKFLICLSDSDFARAWSPSLLAAFLSISRSLVIYLSLFDSFSSSSLIFRLFSSTPDCPCSSCLIIACN